MRNTAAGYQKGEQNKDKYQNATSDSSYKTRVFLQIWGTYVIGNEVVVYTGSDSVRFWRG